MAVVYTHKGETFVFENYISRSGPRLFGIEAAGYTPPIASYRMKRVASIPRVLYVLEYVLDGKGYIVCDGKKHSVQAGDFYMLNNTYDHEYFADSQAPFSKIWINMYGSYIEKLTEAMNFQPLTILSVDVLEEMQNIHSMLKGKSVFEVKQMEADLMAEIMRMLYKVYIFQKNKAEHDNRFIKIKNYIEDHITDDLTVERICTEFFISKSTLYRIFKAELDISPTEYIKEMKIKIASRILSSTNIDINEIVRQLGFYDNSHFSRTFYSIKGMSPSAYRKKKQQ